MKLLCIKDVVTHDSQTGECLGIEFTKNNTYNSKFFRSGTLLYALNDNNDMHIVAECENEEIYDSWFYEHFKIIDKNNNDWKRSL